MSLFAELQRRSVFKVAAAYLVVGWLVVQAASIAFPAFEASPALMRGFILLVLLGFPVALVLAWAFEMTPHGVKVDAGGAGTTRVFLVAGVVAVLSVGWYFRAEIPKVGGDTGVKRLAVLPLANFSPDPNNAFYADGLHDDLLTALSALPGVELVSRTTMQTFKGSTKKLAEIAQETGATQVLEGSVRRDATTVRLTVQLIDARTDDHLWAQTFERPIAEAMTLQNEVAQGVAKTMGLALASTPDAAPPTAVPAAYDLYLKARLGTNRPENLQLLDAALLLDPGYAMARALRALTACQVLWFDDREAAVLAPQARSDIERARKDRPGLALTEVADAVYSYYVDRDYPTALAKVGRVLERDPNHVEAWWVRSNVARRLGRMDESVAAAERGLELDPGNPNAVSQVSEIYRYYGRYRDEIAVRDRFLAGLPEGAPGRDGAVLAREVALYQLTGDPQPILQGIEKWNGTNEAVWDFYHEMKGPSPERIARQMAPGREWVTRSDKFIAPRAVYAARDAEALGDAAARDAALAKAEQLYATLSAEVMARPIVQTTYATIPALRGDAATVRRIVEQAIAGAPPAKDVSHARLVRREAAIALALNGDNAAALDLLEELFANKGSYLYDSYRDANLRQRLGSEPRYQALITKFEAGFEKP